MIKSLRRFAPVALALLAFAGAACGPDVDVRTALRIEAVATGWMDAGSAGGTNKLVPAVSFTVKNASDRTLAPVQVNAIFRRVGSSEEWSNAVITAAGSSGLPPAGASGPLLLKAAVGYTGTDSQWDMLQSSHFVDAKVDLFARYGSQQWAPIGEYSIARVIVER